MDFCVVVTAVVIIFFHSSGGLLVWIDQFPNLRAYLIGIISGGTPDCRPPTVPTIISLVYNRQIVNWLLQKGGNAVTQCLA